VAGDDVSNVLDTIDNALADWETSGDAMRWTPGKAATAAPVGAAVTLTLPEFLEAWRAAVEALNRIDFPKVRRLLVALGELPDDTA
jgi:hypothetical protein